MLTVVILLVMGSSGPYVTSKDERTVSGLYFEKLSHRRPAPQGSFAVHCLVCELFRVMKLFEPPFPCL